MTFRLVGHRAEGGNSLDTVYGDVVDDGVGDYVLKPSNIRESIRELGSLQAQFIRASTAMVSISPPLQCCLDGGDHGVQR